MSDQGIEIKNKYDIVTSFNPDGLDAYARNMLKSYHSHWEDDIKLHAWFHDFGEESFYLKMPSLDIPQGGNIKYLNLNHIKEMLDYREKMKVHNGTEGGKDPVQLEVGRYQVVSQSLCPDRDVSGFSHPTGERLAHLVRRRYTYPCPRGQRVPGFYL